MPALATNGSPAVVGAKRIRLDGDADGDFVRGGKVQKAENTGADAKKDSTTAVNSLPKSLFGSSSAGAKSSKKKSGKRATGEDSSKSSKKKQKQLSVQYLTFKRLDVGTVCMGQVTTVSDYDMTVALPNGLTGRVMITDVCAELTEKANAEARESDDEENEEMRDVESTMPEMSDLFSVGQNVSCVVTKASKNTETRKKEVTLSVDPAHLNKNIRADCVKAGTVLPGVVTSVEDHGYMVSFGVEGLKGFMKKSETESVELYAPISFFVEDVNEDVHTAIVVVDSLRISSAVARSSSGYTFDTLSAGMLVNAVVSECLSDGLVLTFLGFSGTVDAFHFRETITDYSTIEQTYPVKSKLRARILHINRATKRIGLTIRPDLVSLKTTDFSPVEIGQRFDLLPVLRVDSSNGLIFQLPEEAGSHYAYAHISRISDEKEVDLDANKLYKAGKKFSARVVGFSPVDGLVNVSLQESVLSQPFLRHEDIKVGMKVEGTVASVEDYGMSVKVSNSIRGMCPLSHLADFQLKNPKKKFRIGMNVKCRVLSVDVTNKRLLLTNKGSLVKSSLPTITEYADAKPGMKTAGFISAVKPYGCLVSFYNNIRGILPIADLKRAGVANDMVQGKVIKVTVVKVDVVHKKLSLSLATANDENTDQVDTGELKNVEVGRVLSGSIIGGTKLGLQVRIHPSNAVAFLPATHLTDHPSHVERLHAHFTNVKGDLSKLLLLQKEDSSSGAKLTVSMKPSLLLATSEKNDDANLGYVVSTLPSSIEDLREGDIFPGYVRSTANYGVFIGFLGNLTALSALANVSDKYITSTEDVFVVGQSIRAKVMTVDKDAGRVNVSLKMSECFTPMSDLLHHQTYFAEESILSEAAIKVISPAAVKVLKEESAHGVMKGKISAVRPFGVIVDVGAGLTGFVTTEQCKGTKSLDVGDETFARMLDVDVEKKVVDLTIRPEALASENGKKLSKKDIALLKKCFEKSESVAVNVELVKEDYLVVTLPKYDSMLGVALVKDYNDTAKPFSAYTIGQKLSAVIVSLPEAATEAGRPLLSRCVLRLHVKRAVSSTGSHDTVRDSRERLAEMHVGTMVEAIITKRTRGQLNVDIGSHIKGRVHITDVVDEEEALAKGTNPLLGYNKGDVIKARVIGFRDQKTYKTLAITQNKSGKTVVDLSLRRSDLSNMDDNETTPGKRISIESLLVGQSAVGFVHEVVGDHVWVRLSASVRGRIGILDCSSDIKVMSDLASNFPEGLPVKCTVTNVNPAKNSVDLSLLGEAQAELQVGAKVVGVYRQALANKSGVRVELPGHRFGLVHVTDMSDQYSTDPLSEVTEGSIVECVVLAVDNESHRVSLSTRPSVVTKDSKAEVNDAAIRNLSDLSVGQLIRGYVKSISENGCFVWLNHSINARVKIADLSDEFVRDWKAAYPAGRLVSGKIIAVNEQSSRVEMSLKSSDIDPTSAAAKRSQSSALAFEDITKGMTVTGCIRAIERYGVFVKIDGGEANRLSGLAHSSELSDVSILDISKVFSIGDAVKAKILKVDAKKKQISLGLKASYFKDESSSSEGEEDESDAENEGDSDADEDMGEAVESDAMDTDQEEESGNSDDDEDVARGIKRQSSEISKEQLKASLPAVGFGIGFGTSLDANSVEEDEAPDENLSDSGEDSDEEETKIGGKGASKRQKKRAARDEEDRLRAMETALLDPNATPESANDFERLILASPNSSYIWIKYMSMHLGQAEVEKARAVFEQAIKTISFREEREKFNMWKAFMNLEAQFGSDDGALLKAFERACTINDPKKVYLHLAEIYRSLEGKTTELFALYETMVRKFRGSKKMWILYGLDKLKAGDVEATRAVLKRALKALPKRKHVATIIKFAQMEFRFGDPERGRTIFEEVMANYPKRVDLWSVYIDMELRVADQAHIRHLFDRIITLNLSTKKMKFFFKRYLQYERTHGTDKTVEGVKAKARAFVESKMQD